MCGTGRHSLFLSSLGFKVFSVDNNEINLKNFNGSNIFKLNTDVEDKK